MTNDNIKSKEEIRNFCIIAHIDHGKSTLADRILELTGGADKRQMHDQVLDNMELERERGITIKARAVRLEYEKSGKTYIFNLIDTPGHVDFNYEVSRSLAACEGAILVVDSTQGVEAQTLANTYLAIENNLELVPVINKIDLAASDPEKVRAEIEKVIGIPADSAPLISAKNNIGIENVIDAVISNIPAPKNRDHLPLRALIFDSFYDPYKGVVVYVRIMDGTLSLGQKIKFMAMGKVFEVVELGYLEVMGLKPIGTVSSGEVCYIAASIKNIKDVNVGDTITCFELPASTALLGYKKVNSMVYCGIYPLDGAKYDDLRDALDKLKLNDAALSFELENSTALGFGFRCGFLGLLHMEIIEERLEREYDLDLVVTMPSVIYKVIKSNGEEFEVDNPINLPAREEILEIKEPMVSAKIMAPNAYVGEIMQLCQERRGVHSGIEYLDETRVVISYILPLSEIICNFFDMLKSKTKGYASLEYEISEYVVGDLIKLDILLAGKVVDALSSIVHRDKAVSRGRKMVEKLKDVIPRQLFEVPIQAAIGGKIIARETVKALRKDVLAKCYGGDITRKKKLLEKQKEGKKRMRQLGQVEVPQEAFMSILKLEE